MKKIEYNEDALFAKMGNHEIEIDDLFAMFNMRKVTLRQIMARLIEAGAVKKKHRGGRVYYSKGSSKKPVAPNMALPRTSNAFTPELRGYDLARHMRAAQESRNNSTGVV